MEELIKLFLRKLFTKNVLNNKYFFKINFKFYKKIYCNFVKLQNI